MSQHCSGKSGHLTNRFPDPSAMCSTNTAVRAVTSRERLNNWKRPNTCEGHVSWWRKNTKQLHPNKPETTSNVYQNQRQDPSQGSSLKTQGTHPANKTAADSHWPRWTHTQQWPLLKILPGSKTNLLSPSGSHCPLKRNCPSVRPAHQRRALLHLWSHWFNYWMLKMFSDERLGEWSGRWGGRWN